MIKSEGKCSSPMLRRKTKSLFLPILLEGTSCPSCPQSPSSVSASLKPPFTASFTPWPRFRGSPPAFCRVHTTVSPPRPILWPGAGYNLTFNGSGPPHLQAGRSPSRNCPVRPLTGAGLSGFCFRPGRSGKGIPALRCLPGLLFPALCPCSSGFAGFPAHP